MIRKKLTLNNAPNKALNVAVWQGDGQTLMPSERLSLPAKALVVVSPVIFVVILFVTHKVLPVILTAAVTFLPGSLWFSLINNFLQDHAVTDGAKLTQIFVGFVQARLLTHNLALLISTALFPLLFVRGVLVLASKALELNNYSGKFTKVELAQLDKEATRVIQLPFRTLNITGLLSSFVAIALLEQLSNVFMTRRYRGVRDINVRGVIAFASLGALGLATSELFLQATKMLTVESVYTQLLRCLYQALLALSMRMGTAFYTGVAVAKKHYLRKGGSVIIAVVLGFLFHVAFVGAELYAKNQVNQGSYGVRTVWAVTFGFHVILLVLLGLLCREAYSRILDPASRRIP